jgi:predicted phage tail protein
MQELTIYGEGKGGGGHTPVEAKDTLKSKQTMRLLFALSEGEIDSVSDILVNSASISNYKADVVKWEVRTGTLDQELIKGFSEVEAPIAGSGTFPIELKYNVEKVYNLLGQYDAARVTLSMDRLMKVTDEGDRVGYTVSLDIYKRRKLANGTTENWQLAADITKKGKCTNVYAWDVRIDKPAGTLFADSWEIKIVRTSLDDAKDSLMSKTFLANIITITERTLTYPKTALLGVTIYDAKTFGTSIPELKFKVKGMKFLLPSNYTASSRNYNESTPWNGSFKSYTEYTDNLAWVTYWVLRNNDWGLGVSAADIDLGSFYTYAKHCDEMVPAGNTTEPRYTVHLQCIERENVPTFLMKLLTLGNANFSSNAFGQIKIVWDGAGQAITKVVSNATVVDGMFDYTSNDLEGRTNLVNVTYAREDFFGDSDTVTHYEDSLITRYGLQTSDVILLGCKSEYQALRKARWTLYNNCYSGDLVTFKQLFQGAHYQIGELVSVMDSDNVSSNAKHGIIKSSSVSGGQVTIVLDRTITLTNASYSVEFIGTDGTTFSSKTINQSNGSFSTITFVGTDSPYTGSTILFKTAALTPRVIKVLKIEKDDSHVYTITGLTHDEDKYNYIDSTGTIVKPSTSGSYVNFDNFSVPAVTNLVIDQVHVVNRGVEFSKLDISWDWSSGSTTNDFKAIFEVSYRRDAQDFIQLKELSTTNFDIEYPLPGVYEVYVWAVNPFSGIKSIVTTTINPYNYRVAAAVSSLVPPTTVVVPNTVGVAFTQPDLHLSWMYNTVNDTKEDALKDYIIQVLDTATRTVKGTYTVVPNKDKGGEFVFTFYENFTIFGTPQRNFIVKVYSRDIIGDLSNYVEVNPTNVIPGVQSFDILSGVSSVFVRITTTPEADIAGYQVFRSLTANFTKDSSTLVYDGPDTYITLNVPSSSTYYYAVAAYDSFSKTGLSVSGEQNSTPLSADATTWTKTGLQFTVDSVVANKLNWTAGTVIRNGSNTYTITAGTTTWTSGFVYVYFNPAVSLTALQVTTTLLIAVGVGCYPIATYTGGSASNIKGGDGNAFISGSQIIAGTVGASEIKAGSIVASLIDTTNAVITGTAQITDGIITNAKIGNSIMSLDYNPTTYKGWIIDKAGNINTYGSLGLYDTSGNVIFAGGNFNWNNAKGPGVPQAGATRNVFLGGWSRGYNYVVGDIVTDTLGYGWSCTLAHTSSVSITTPSYPTTSTAYWALYAVKGVDGTSAVSTTIVSIYKRVAGVNPIVPLPSATVNYNFNSGVITGLTNGWAKDVPTGTDPLYIAAATAIGTGSDDILKTEWSSPILFVQNGTNTATITLYQTTTTATPVPVAPNIPLTYTFADASIVETIPNGWKRTLPTTGTYRWMTTATAVSTTATDSIAASEWSAVSLMGQDGINGSSAAIFGIDNAAAVFNKNLSNVISPSAGITLTTSYQNITGTLSYQWQKNGVNITGATSSSYTVPTSDYSSVTSNNYKVTIIGTINGVSGSLSDNITIPMLVDGGSSAVVLFSNDNIIFGAPNVLYSGIDFSNGTCDITAYIGSTELTYASSGANTFSLTYTASGATVGAGTNPTTKILRIPAPTAMSVESAVVTVTITPRDSAGNALPLIVRTLRYNLSRAGAVGMSYWLANTDYLKRSPSLVYSPTSITLSGYSATGSGIPAAYPCRFKIYEDGSATASYTSSVDEATKSYTPSTTAVKYIKVEMYLAGGTTTLVDYSTIPVVQDGSQALTLVEPNSAVLLSAASDGTVSASAYTGSGTTIKVLEGSTLLTFTTGVVGKGQFGISTSVTNGTITVGGISGNGTTTCTVANHSGLTTNSASITYTINVVKLDGTAVTLTDVQTLTKSIAGTPGVGTPGNDAVIGQLSSDSIMMSCNSAGNPVGISPYATVTMTVNKGGVDDSANWTYSVSLSNLTSSSLTTSRTQNITGFGGGVTNQAGYIEFTASRAGYSSIVKRCVFAKSIPGVAGAGTSYTGSTDPLPNPANPTAAANPSAAINGDSYFQTTTQLMWVKIAGTWQKVVPQITDGNKSTFIADAAIGQAQIGSLAVGTAQIIGASVETLKIKGTAVTIPYGYSLPAAVTMAATNTWVTKGTITIAATDSPDVDLILMILYGASAYCNTGIYSGAQIDMRISINNTVQNPTYTTVLLAPADGGPHQGNAANGIKFTATKGTAYTINLQTRVGGGTSVTLENAYITAIGTKR